MSLPLTHPTMIKEIIIGISLCLLIFGVVFLFPLLGIFAPLFLPLPILFYRLKLGRNSGGIVMAIRFFILLFITGGQAFGVLYFGTLLMTGFIMGECLERQFTIQRTVVSTIVTAVGTGFAALFLFTLVQGTSITAVLTNYQNGVFEMCAKLYSQIGMDETQTQQTIASLKEAMIYLPGMLTVTFMMTIWLNIMIIRSMLAKRGFVLKSVAHLNRFRAPEHTVWAVIVFGLALMTPVSQLEPISINSLIVLINVYFFQGIAVVSFFFEKKQMPMPLKVFCYSLIVIQIYLTIMVVGLGFFDNWINFRKLNTAAQ